MKGQWKDKEFKENFSELKVIRTETDKTLWSSWPSVHISALPQESRGGSGVTQTTERTAQLNYLGSVG